MVTIASSRPGHLASQRGWTPQGNYCSTRGSTPKASPTQCQWSLHADCQLSQHSHVATRPVCCQCFVHMAQCSTLATQVVLKYSHNNYSSTCSCVQLLSRSITYPPPPPPPSLPLSSNAYRCGTVLPRAGLSLAGRAWGVGPCECSR